MRPYWTPSWISQLAISYANLCRQFQKLQTLPNILVHSTSYSTGGGGGSGFPNFLSWLSPYQWVCVELCLVKYTTIAVPEQVNDVSVLFLHSNHTSHAFPNYSLSGLINQCWSCCHCSSVYSEHLSQTNKIYLHCWLHFKERRGPHPLN